MTKVVTWLWSAAEHARGPVVWISNAQLYVDYVLNTGDAGPIHLEGWRDSADYPLHALQQIGFKERARWFGKVLREILRHAGIQVESSYCRPASLMVCMYASCLALPWCAQRLEAVDKWMQSFGQGAIQTAFHSKLKSKFSKTLARIVLNFMCFTLARLHWDYNPRFGPFNHQCES